MAQLTKTWTGPTQTAFVSAVDQVAQYRQEGYAKIQAFLSVGWTIERVSNGTNAGNGSSFATGAIEDADDIIFGTEASQAHSWASLVPPSGKGNPPGGAAFRLLINFNNSNADTTPQNVDYYLAHGTYVGGANGTTTTRPSILAGGVELSVLSINMVPWNTTTIAGSFCIWTTSDGDLYFATKANGESFFRNLWWIRDDSDNGVGNYTMTLFGVSSTSDIVTATQLTSSGNHRGFLADGSAGLSAMFCNCSAFALTQFTLGQEATTNRIPLRDVELQNNAAGAGARDFGVLVDVLGGPPAVGFNQEDTEDDGDSLPFIFRTIGDLAMPCDAALT